MLRRKEAVQESAVFCVLHTHLLFKAISCVRLSSDCCVTRLWKNWRGCTELASVSADLLTRLLCLILFPGGASAIDQLASSPAALTVPTPPPPGVLDRIDPLAAAANLLHKPEVDLREQRRRSSGFAGGQQGYVRFADATLRDPNYHLQFQDLLTQQQGGKKRSGSLGETGSVGSGGGGDSSIASPTGEGSYTTGSHSRESGEEK